MAFASMELLAGIATFFASPLSHSLHDPVVSSMSIRLAKPDDQS